MYKFLHSGYPNILCLSLNLDIVSITHVKAKLMLCSLMSHTLPLQYTSPLSILASALLTMLQSFGMICLMMYVQPLLSTRSKRNSKPISLHKHIQPNFCFSWFLSVALTRAICLRLMFLVFHFFCLVCLQSVFRWRLSIIKILLEFLNQVIA